MPKSGPATRTVAPAACGWLSTNFRSETRRDHHTEPVVEQRPYGMFTGRPDAEIRAGHENRGARRVRLVEHEFPIGNAPRSPHGTRSRAAPIRHVHGTTRCRNQGRPREPWRPPRAAG